jgi:anthranilate synthase component 1
MESVNRKLKNELLRDKKELAEHTMLVDLARNDLGRICKFGSVQPKELMIVKRFSHVQHLVSHITGTLDDKYDSFDAFRSLFPAGTVSGAPKLRAMEVISELEKSSRGPYAGALGYFSFNRCCDFAIIIRSLFINRNNAYIQSGAGIVTDSIPINEYLETEHKAGALFSALQAAKNH